MALADLNLNNPWQMDAARKKIDPVMRELVDQLDDAYYGTPKPDNTRQKDGWKHGVQSPFFSWNYLPTDDNKLKFDLVSGIIHHLTFLAQHLFNTDEAQKYPEAKYNEPLDENGDRLLRSDATPLTKVWAAKQTIKQLVIDYNAAGLTPPLTSGLITGLTNWIKAQAIVVEVSSRRKTDVDAVLDYEVDTDI